MDFVDDVYPELAGGGHELDVFSEFSNIIDAAVGRPIDLLNINRRTLGYFHTNMTLVAGDAGFTFQTGDGLGQDPGHRGLAHATGPAKQVRVRQSVALDGIHQGLGNVILADNVLKDLWAPFSG
jgi:hypothetical protein